MREEKIPPVKIFEEIKITIISIGTKGDGIGRYEGFVIITPETETEKTYKVKIIKVFPNYAIAEVIKEV